MMILSRRWKVKILMRIFSTIMVVEIMMMMMMVYIWRIKRIYILCVLMHELICMFTQVHL